MSSTPPRFGHDLRRHWLLEDGIVYLNHGSVGATPRAVLAAQDEWRQHIEREPVRFMSRDLPAQLRAAAARLAEFLGGDGEGLVFVDNATSAVNVVLASIDWHAGDEIVVLREAYPGVRNAIERHALSRGTRLREARFEVPLREPQEVTDALAAALGPRTRLALIDHVGSTLATVYPLAAMVALCHERGVPVLVDGAHGPGMLEVALAATGADWYAGNCHKWLCAPRGCGFLWTAPERRATTRPLVASVWHGEGYPLAFDWPGTRDPSVWLAVGAAIDLLQGFGVDAVRAYTRSLAAQAAATLSVRWNTPVAAPEAMRAAMAAIRVPGIAAEHAAALHDRLLDTYRIEVPVYPIDGAAWLRISAQIYLEPRDLLALGEAVPEAAAALTDPAASVRR